jgi:tRNA-dihydrouridine synthase
MAELSHRALRELIASFGGCDAYFTEMISAAALLSGGEFEPYYMDNLPEPEKLVYQLAGAHEDQLARAAALLDKRECAGIDINMGCAAPAITRTGAGIKWMYSPEKATKMIEKVRKSVKKRLSVKLRLGPGENFEYLLDFCRALENAGTELITLHPRTAREKFRRKARWQYVEALAKELSIPVAGNGDIADAAELALRAWGQDRGPWKAVMAGRAAVRRPWIFSQARLLKTASGSAGTEDAPQTNAVSGPVGAATVLPEAAGKTPPALIEETGLRFLELLSRYQPPPFHLSRARRFFYYFCDNLIWGNHVKTLLNKEESLSGIAQARTKYFKSNAE